MSRLTPLAVLLIAGCQTAPRDAAVPMHGDRRVVAVLPFFDETGRSSFDADEFGNLLASEVVKNSGARVIRPAHLRTGDAIESIADAVRVARKLGADTVLACAVTDYDPYDPPRVGVHVQVLRTEPRTLSTKDLDVLLQSASWKKGPLTMTREGAGHALAAFEAVYDSRDPATRRVVADYAQRTGARETEIAAVQSRWMQFVSHQILLRVHGS